MLRALRRNVNTSHRHFLRKRNLSIQMSTNSDALLRAVQNSNHTCRRRLTPPPPPQHTHRCCPAPVALRCVPNPYPYPALSSLPQGPLSSLDRQVASATRRGPPRQHHGSRGHSDGLRHGLGSSGRRLDAAAEGAVQAPAPVPWHVAVPSRRA